MNPTPFLRSLVCPQRAATLAERFGVGGLMVALFVVPLLLGGRHDLARFVYTLAAASAAVGMVVRHTILSQSVRLSLPIVAVVSAAVGLVGLQLLPCPPGLQALLGPDLETLLPLWREGTSWGAWRTLSLNPGVTANSLALLMAHGLLFVAWSLWIKTHEDLRRAAVWLGGAAIGMALVGVGQYVLNDPSLFGLYRHPQRDFSDSLQGSFTNRNHFAHFLILGSGAAAWMALQCRAPTVGRWRRLAAWGACALLATCVVATQSRGGVLVFGAVATTFGLLAWRAGALSLRHVGALSAVMLVALGGITLFGYERATARMADLTSVEVEQLDSTHARRAIWMANLSAWRASPWLGFGAGTHRDVYPSFIDRGYAKEFTHAESSYLQIASETGLAGCGVLLTLLVTVGVTAVRCVMRSLDTETALLIAAVAAGLVGSSVHAVFDFVWHVPGLTAPAILLVAMLVRIEALTRTPKSAVDSCEAQPRRCLSAGRCLTAVTMAASFALTLLLPAARAAGDWDQYLRRSVSLRAMSEQFALSTNSDQLLAATIVTTVDQAARGLGSVTEKNPTDARARLRLAGKLLQTDALTLSEQANPLSLDLVRDAAEKGGFDDHEQRTAWLQKALGDRYGRLLLAKQQAENALRLCPLQARAYLYLASLAFLDERSVPPEALIEQAVCLRPKSGAVLFEAGRQHWVAGRADRAFELWSRAVRLPGNHLVALTHFTTSFLSAEEFVARIEPGLPAMELAINRYTAGGTPEDLVYLCECVQTQAQLAERSGEEDDVRLAYRWRQVSQTLRSIGRPKDAVESAERAVRLAAHLTPMRLELAAALYQAERFEEADPQLRWCLARRPDLRYLHDWLQDVAKRRTSVASNRQRRRTQEAVLASRPPSDSQGDAAENLPAEESVGSPAIESLRR